jgi:RNA polymerase sigma-70 factor (ECF subfamily)
MNREDPHDVSHATLLRRCSQGDDDAAAELVRQWQPKVFDLAARLLGNLEEGESVAQEALLRTLTAVRDPQGASVRHFGAYAMRTARNLSVDRLRHAAVVRRAPADPTPESAPPRETRELERLRGHVQELEGELREIVELRYVQELSFGQMATRLGLSKNGVFSRHARALAALRERLMGADR